MSKVKVTYIISNINKALAFEWIAESFINKSIQLSFILLNDVESELEHFLRSKNVNVDRIQFSGTKKDLSNAFFQVLNKMINSRPDAIHCHMFDACIIGLSAGMILNVKKRIFTRHSGSYNWSYNQKGHKYDRLLAWLATDIVAISENVKNLLLQEGAKENKINIIHHGFKLNEFENIIPNRISKLKNNFNPSNKQPVIGVISRWLHLKGIQYIIPAFKKLLNDYPDALLILANANGPYKPEIEKLLTGLLTDSYRIIPFENDLFALYQLFDIYVHTPINPTIEAFGQTYVESLAAGIPSVFTMSGVAPEFIEHEKNALVVPFKDSEAIYMSMKRLMEDEKLKLKIVENGRNDLSGFELDKMITKLQKLYEE
ncbi:MAG: glycosyltransferase family 4 protein [Cyclobacteriaceae bacterium]|nr:glycosyltransferase family 4 protein [Cyclobacteriaceae bacterium]